MGLISAIWQKMIWCALIGGGMGLVIGAATAFQPEPRQYSLGVEVVVDTLLGTLLGLIVLGGPAAIWVTIKRMIHGKPAAVPASDTTSAQTRGAVIGSAAAIPVAIGGAIAGVALAAAVLGCLMFVSFLVGAPWFETITRHWLGVWFGGAAAFGAVAGFLAGTFVGGALGAIFGGVRAYTRH